MRASKKRRNHDLVRRETEDDNAALGLTEHSWSGPLPPPAALREFDDLVENGAERIVCEWEQESAHRRNYEIKALRAHVWLDSLRRISAFIFAMSALGLTGRSVG